MSEPAVTPSSTRGLATLALLKANFDRGRDHLAMFQPFVDDTVLSSEVDGLTDPDVQKAVAARHQLTLPLATVRTLLHRATKQGLVRREGGRYFSGDQPKKPAVDLAAQRREVEARQANLADGYLAWASSEGTDLVSREAALQSLIGFVERNHVRLALSTPVDEIVGVHTGIDEDPDRKSDRLAARFLETALRNDPGAAEVVRELLEGYVLQNALFLTDVSASTRRFSGLRVIFDSALLFGALGLQGDGQGLLTRDLIDLLREEGAKPEAFATTLREMRRVLAVYESKLGTAAGRRALYPTDLTRFFLTSYASPSDVRTISATLERSLEALGLTIVETPDHVATFTLDEAALGTRLASRAGGETDPRVVHDVDCVAAVLTIRRGRSSDSLDSARAIFVTSSQLTVKTVVDWYEDDGGAGVPPIVHLLTLSNLTWLKRPGRAATMKLNELIALCAAALRPSRQLWSAFQVHLDRLEKDGKVTSDEVTAIMASSLTDRFLADEIEDDPDADSLTEVVERVKRSLTEHADIRVAEALSKVAHLERREADRRSVLSTRSRRFGTVVSWGLAVLIVSSLLLGTVATIMNLASGAQPAIWAIVLGLVPLAILGLFGAVSGFNVRDWRRKVSERVTAGIDRWQRTNLSDDTDANPPARGPAVRSSNLERSTR